MIGSARRRWSRARDLAVAATLIAALAGCTSISDFSFEDINPFGQSETILPGERQTILTETDPLEVDRQSASVPALPAQRANADWPQPGGTANNAPGHLALNASVTRAWGTRAGQGSSGETRLSAPPIVYQGRVYVMDVAATVTAISLTGGRGWNVSLRPEGEEADGVIGGGLAADGGRLYAATGYGSIVALDPDSGGQLWIRDLRVPIRSAPTAAGGRIFVVAADSRIHALSAEDGSDIWSYRGIPEATGLIASTSPAVSGDTVVVPYSSGEVIAFNAASGSPVWTDSLTRTQLLTSLSGINDVAARPVIDAGTAYAVSVSGRMIAADLRSGERNWTRNIAGTQAPAAAGETIYVVSLNGQLAALARSGGQVRWITQLPGDRSVRWNGPVLAGGQLWLSSSAGNMVSVDATSGQVSGQYPLGAASYIAPIVASGTLFLLLDDGTLVAFN